MTEKYKIYDSNLFKIDFEAIHNRLNEANKDLIDKAKNTINSISDIPEKIRNDHDLEILKIKLKNIHIMKNDLRNNRLRDGRPFSDAKKIVENFFGSYEKSFKDISEFLNSKASAYLKNNSYQSKKTDLGIDYEGNTIVSPDNEINKDTNKENFPVIWEIEDYNLEIIDLEELRTCFSKNSILSAIRNHLKKNGPNKLKGVTYRTIPKI